MTWDTEVWNWSVCHKLFYCHVFVYSEGVRFKFQPQASPVVEGQRLELECEASGVPSPSYLWFKSPQVPLPEQTQRLLIIERVQKDDEGMYCCRATNDVNVVFSNWAEVKVMKPPILNKSECFTFSI